jgi:hypothetical protein
MKQLPSKTSLPKTTDAVSVTDDNGKIRTGGGYRLPPAEIADGARVRVGGGYRLPTA